MSKHTQGRVEVICGSMFSGKTEELIRRLRRAVIAKQNVQVFKPKIDNRYHSKKVASHDGIQFDAKPVSLSHEILICLTPGTTVVGIDEVQFFDDAVVKVCDELTERNIRVICAGLDMDFRGETFGPVPELMARAEQVTKLQAICVQCGESASRTQRLINDKPAAYNDPIVMVGATEVYEARCRHCHDVPQSE